MGIDDLRKRLGKLNRSPLAAGGHGHSARGPGRGIPDARLETLVPGEPVRLDDTSFYAVERPLSEHWEPSRVVFERFARAMHDPVARERAGLVHPELVALIDSGADRLLLVDLETCGFAGTPVFLIGTLYVKANQFHVEQLLARDYGEEAGILGRFGELLSQRSHLVTFNGKSFDWPFVADRAAVARIALGKPSGHCDLLHVARRRYGGILPDCKLQTVERHVSGRARVGDIDGRDIPAAYHGFVNTGNARQLRDILHHNFLDLVTLTEIIAALIGD